jgi:hypothetical protein
MGDLNPVLPDGLLSMEQKPTSGRSIRMLPLDFQGQILLTFRIVQVLRLNAYTDSSSSVTFLYQDVTFPAGEVKINLSFKLLVQERLVLQELIYDYFRVYLVPTSFTPSAGTVPSTSTYPNNWTLIF